MKAAIVLSGSPAEIKRQSIEISGFLEANPCADASPEAWVLCEEELDSLPVLFGQNLCAKVVHIGSPFVGETALPAIERLYEINQPQLMLFGSDAFSAGTAVRAAHRLQGSSCVGVVRCGEDDGRFIIEKRVYSNNLTGRFALKFAPYCVSVAKGFTGKEGGRCLFPQIEQIAYSPPACDWLIGSQSKEIEKKNTLADAKFVVAVGKGIGGKDGIPMLNELAQLLGAGLGASRPVVLSAWMDMEQLIGASGAILSADVCVAIGVSGAAAFSVGIEKCAMIVAVNHDEHAPLFKIADIGVCADWRQFVPALIEAIKQSDAETL